MAASKTKELALGIFTVASGLASAYLWREALEGGRFSDLAFYSLPVYWVTLLLAAGVVRLFLMKGFLNQKTETIQVTKITL